MLLDIWVEEEVLEEKLLEQKKVQEGKGVENEVVGAKKLEQEGARQDWSLLASFLSSMGTPVLVLVRLYSEI